MGPIPQSDHGVVDDVRSQGYAQHRGTRTLSAESGRAPQSVTNRLVGPLRKGTAVDPRRQTAPLRRGVCNTPRTSSTTYPSRSPGTIRGAASMPNRDRLLYAHERPRQAPSVAGSFDDDTCRSTVRRSRPARAPGADGIPRASSAATIAHWRRRSAAAVPRLVRQTRSDAVPPSGSDSRSTALRGFGALMVSPAGCTRSGSAQVVEQNATIS